MSLKLKVLGLGVLAVVATSAFAAMNASAITGGHFYHHNPAAGAIGEHAIVTGTEGGPHQLHFVNEGGAEGERIGCDKDHYHGTVTTRTSTHIDITPTWSECYTTGSPNTKFDVHENGCSFTFTSGKTGQTHHTVHVDCPEGKAFVITHPNCTITVPAQTTQSAAYTTTTINGIDALTVKITAKKITTHYHGGICIFLGTTHSAEMTGSVTVEAFDTDGVQIPITETTGA